jgi:hypothetical protein
MGPQGTRCHGSVRAISLLVRRDWPPLGVGKSQPPLFSRLKEPVVWAGLPPESAEDGTPTLGEGQLGGMRRRS